jgi:protein phosphatase
MPLRSDIGVCSSRGIGPLHGGRERNEDNFLVCSDGRVRFRDGGAERERRADGPGTLLAVADGMGGHEHGEVASGAAVQALARLHARGRPRKPEGAMRAFVTKAHGRLRDLARSRGAANMGTTLTACWILEDVAYWTHVGDSRLYLLRDSALSLLTRDHTRREFARRDGRPEPFQPQALVQNFIFGSRGLGDDSGIRVDPGRDTGSFPVRVGDRLLLASDGVFGPLRHDHIRELLGGAASATAAATSLVGAAMEAGGDDNLTAVVLIVKQLQTAAAADWRLYD